MPLWGWLLLVVAVVLAVMSLHDRRVQARGGRLNDPGAMERRVAGPQASPDAHRNPLPWGGGSGS
jgi:hypothetical protein